jgi:hypothetical protein
VLGHNHRQNVLDSTCLETVASEYLFNISVAVADKGK